MNKEEMHEKIKKVLYNEILPDIDDKYIDIQYIVGTYVEELDSKLTKYEQNLKYILQLANGEIPTNNRLNKIIQAIHVFNARMSKLNHSNQS